MSTIALSKAGRLLPAFAGRGVIFTLHHVRPKKQRAFDPNAHLEITPEFLETAILAAKSAGYQMVPLSDLPQLLATGDPARRYCAFTLDDGYRNNATFAAPVFRKHAVPFTIFVCPGFAERSRIMWWETIADILEKAESISFDFGKGPQTRQTRTLFQKNAAFDAIADVVETIDEDEAVKRIHQLATHHGIDPLQMVEHEIMGPLELADLASDPLCTLGGHTLTHCNLARTDPARLDREIAGSAAKVAQWSGKPVDTFAYPYGWKHAAGQREFTAAKMAGMVAAVTTVPGVLTANAIATGLPRISLNGHYQKRRYVEAMISGLPFILS